VTIQRREMLPLSAVLVAVLAACGGGGVNSTPTPPALVPNPPATTPPAPFPPAKPGPIGLTQTENFATVSYGYVYGDGNAGADTRPGPEGTVEFKYLAAEQAYEIVIPEYERGRLQTISYNGSVCSDGTVCNPSGSYNALTKGNSATRQDVTVTLRDPDFKDFPLALTYTSLGYWNGTLANQPGPNPLRNYGGEFAYGLPTAPGDVPVVGTASYRAEVQGIAIFDSGTSAGATIGGTAELIFDFGAGTLAGYMDPNISDGWDASFIGRYNFTQTIYSVGATSFSGRFTSPGSTGPSGFEGRFNGPQAAELMARWKAPFIDPLQRGPGTMFGIWVGKKN
jgi:hypothetical protein